MSAAGDLPDKFRKRGIDCAIHLNVAMLFKDIPTPIHMSAAGVVLISAAIAVKYTDRVVLLKHPQLTIYSRPKPEQLAAAVGESLYCVACGVEGTRGLWWCLSCWEPHYVGGCQRPPKLPCRQQRATP